MTAQELDDFLVGAFPGSPRAYRVSEVTAAGATLTMPTGPEHERPGGTVSGPTMMSLADGAAWLATLSRIGPVPMAVTSSLTMHFLDKPPLGLDLVADATLLRLGARSSVTDVRISAGATLVATATVAYSIPPLR